MVFILTIVSSIIINFFFYDTTHDGNTYHKTAIGMLKYGWNPVYESIDSYNEKLDDSLKLNTTHAIWNDHYANGTWIYASSVYSLTNSIETGKSIYCIIGFATFLIAISFLSKILKKNLLAVALAILITVNPVFVSQMFSYYNDGVLGNLLIILLISLTLMISDKFKEVKSENYFLTFVLISLLINIKFTGLAYAGIYCLAYYLYIAVKKDLRNEYLWKFTKIGIKLYIYI